MDRLVEAFRARMDEFVADSSARVAAADLPFYRSLPPPVRAGAIRDGYTLTGLLWWLLESRGNSGSA